MDYARHLEKVPLEYLGRWIANPAEDASYKEQVIATLMSMHTYIKSLKPDATHNTYLYPWPRHMITQEKMASSDAVGRALTA